ncbi:putative reverse transcriptase domain-containing protein [Tanacetum coccineum]
MAPTTRAWTNYPTDTTNPNNMTPETVQAMIDQALLRNSTNGNGCHSSHGDNRRNVQTARPCYYAEFMKCQPLNFKGTEGVVGLTRSTGNTNVANIQKGNGEAPKGNGCFECGAPWHFKKDCSKLKNKNGGNGNAQGWVYVVGNAEKNGNASGNPDSNVVTGTFFLNNHYASVLFDTGADRSFISIAFSSLIDIVPTPLENSKDYIAEGK